MHPRSLAALSLFPVTAADTSSASEQNGTAISARRDTSVPDLFLRDPLYTSRRPSTKGGGSRTATASAASQTGVVTTSHSLKPSATSNHPKPTQSGAYATNAASIVCAAANWPPADCQSRNDISTSAKSVIQSEFNATEAGEVMKSLADLSSCSSAESTDNLDQAQKQDLRKTTGDLLNSKYDTVSAVQRTFDGCQTKTSDGGQSNAGSVAAALAGIVVLGIGAVV